MAKAVSTLAFKATALWFRIRDILTPPEAVLNEVGIGLGDRVLDFGCGPGSYALAAAERVGASGRVYAVDINPLALECVKERASQKGLSHIEVVHTDGPTGIASGSLDVVLLYDTYHDLREPKAVMGEVHRVLRPGGILSFNDHHMKEEDIVAELTQEGLFRLSNKGQKTYTFTREG